MRILLTGGGTAGHAWPIILVGKSLAHNKRNKILYVGSRQGIEQELVRKTDIPFKAILVGKRRAYFSFSNYWDLLKIFLGILQAAMIFLKFRPEVIFAKGGYVSFPIIFWLGFFKVPLVIHESDVVFGQANLFALKYARKICLGFPLKYYQNLPLEKCHYTGIPIRSEFYQPQVRTSDIAKILITGGSQGSSKINNLISEILNHLVGKYDITHICGKLDYEKLNKLSSSNYHVFSYVDNPASLMRDADLIISRAGANTLAEISALKKASILVPLASAKGEHQSANAQVYQKENAAIVLSEDKISANSLQTIIDDIMNDNNLRNLIGHHAHAFYIASATDEIIDCLFEVKNV